MFALPKAAALLLATAILGGGTMVGVSVLQSPSSAVAIDYGVDNDGNGRFDYLVVRVAFDAPAAGPYLAWGSLLTSHPVSFGCGGLLPAVRMANGGPMAEGVIAWSYQSVFLEKGRRSIAFGFPGTDISRSGADGPYEARYEITLGEGGPIPLESRAALVRGPEGFHLDGSHTTQAYRASDFEELPIAARFTGVYADDGVDGNGSGAFEFLRIAAEVDVSVPGPYMLDGQLTTPSAQGDGVTWIAWTWSTVELTGGRTTVNASFPGEAIRDSGVDGPYAFHLVLQFNDPQVLAEPGSAPPASFLWPPGAPPYPPACLDGTTKPYAASDFERGGPTYWIDSLRVATGKDGGRTAVVAVACGGNMLAVVIENTVTLELFDARGGLVFTDAANVALPSPGSRADIAFTLPFLGPGTYTVRATLGLWDRPANVMEIELTV